MTRPVARVPRTATLAIVLCTSVSGATSACGGDDGAVAYDPVIDPAHFGSTVDSPWFPLVPGTVFTYDVRETREHLVVTVTSDTRVVMGVTCVVVRDVASIDGTVIEDTFDWYAQDDAGDVWYFGEDTTAFDGPMTSKAGSWEGGVDGAKPGRVALAHPHVGDRYRQEYRVGEAEDEAEVIALDASVTVPYGTFTGCLRTRDFSALEPAVEENKLYCPGVGQVLAVSTVGAPETEELTSVTSP